MRNFLKVFTMPVTWTEDKTLRLLRLYNRHECLKYQFHPNFKDKLCRYCAYKEITHSMNVNGITIFDCIKRITFLKTRYSYELSKISAAISCEKFYAPQASLFRIMHEIFFPLTQTSRYANNSWQTQNQEEDIEHYCNNFVGFDSTSHSNCKCFYVSHQRENRPRSKCLAQSKEQWYGNRHQSRNENDVAKKEAPITRKLSCPPLARNVNNDAESNTANIFTARQETQRDISFLNSEYNKSRINGQKEKAVKSVEVNNENEYPKDTTDLNREKMKKRDEFDMFGKSIAYQLRNMEFEAAVELEKRIQNLLTKERLVKIKPTSVSEQIDLECCCSCSDCKIIADGNTCSCGSPVILITGDQCCDSTCK